MPTRISERSAATATRLLTGDDLLRLPDDGRDYELVRGELIEMPPPGGSHGDRQSCLAQLLRNFNDEAELGTVLTESGFYLRRDPDTVRGPDVMFISKEKLDPNLEVEGYFEVVPDLVVEVISPSDRHSDVMAKVDEYLAAGVRAIWLVDSRRHAVTIYPGAQTLHETDTLTGGEVLPGFQTPVWRIFRRKESQS